MLAKIIAYGLLLFLFAKGISKMIHLSFLLAEVMGTFLKAMIYFLLAIIELLLLINIF